MKEGGRGNGGVKDCKFLFILKGRTLNDLKVASSRANNDEHLSSQVLKSKPKMYMFRATKKYKCARKIRLKAKSLQHFEGDPI